MHPLRPIARGRFGFGRRVAFGTIALAALLSGCLAREAEKAQPLPMPEAMIRALANRNSAPMIIDETDRNYPEFGAGFQRSEQARVIDAISELAEDSRIAVWEELLIHTQDQQYCVSYGVDGFQSNHSVGDMCHLLATFRLQAALHICVDEDESLQRKFDLPAAYIADAARWRRSNADKQLYELQLEILENARRQLPAIEDLSPAEARTIEAAIVARIKLLQNSKRADFARFRFPGDRDVARGD